MCVCVKDTHRTGEGKTGKEVEDSPSLRAGQAQREEYI